MTKPTLLSLDRVQAAYTRIDTIWADAEADNRPASVAEAELALQELATAVGLEPDPDEKEGEPLISLALAVTRALRDALLAAGAPGNPADEYERLLRAAEDQAPRNPAAARALLKTADRWMNDELSAARNISTRQADARRIPSAAALIDAGTPTPAHRGTTHGIPEVTS